MADPNAAIENEDQNDTYQAVDDQGSRRAEQSTFQSTVELDDPDEPASGGMQQGANHTRWDTKDETWGQGPKTLKAQREQNKRGT